MQRQGIMSSSASSTPSTPFAAARPSRHPRQLCRPQHPKVRACSTAIPLHFPLHSRPPAHGTSRSRASSPMAKRRLAASPATRALRRLTSPSRHHARTKRTYFDKRGSGMPLGRFLLPLLSTQRLTIATDVASASPPRLKAQAALGFRSQRSCKIRTHIHTQTEANNTPGASTSRRRPPLCLPTAEPSSARVGTNSEQADLTLSSWRKGFHSAARTGPSRTDNDDPNRSRHLKRPTAKYFALRREGRSFKKNALRD